MDFIIRHEISPLEEEIYEFEISNHSIRYKCFWSSKRKSVNEPFGYDWGKFYEKDKNEELKKLEEEFEAWEEIDECDLWHPKCLKYDEIVEKYNPVEHGLLSGVISSRISKEHPVKVSKELIMEKAIEKLKSLRIDI